MSVLENWHLFSETANYFSKTDKIYQPHCTRSTGTIGLINSSDVLHTLKSFIRHFCSTFTTYETSTSLINWKLSFFFSSAYELNHRKHILFIKMGSSMTHPKCKLALGHVFTYFLGLGTMAVKWTVVACWDCSKPKYGIGQ